jgi:hypothetical protein
MKRILCFMVIPIAVAWIPGAAMPAHASEKLTITMKVTSSGLITTDVPMVEKKIFLPRGTRVRLVLEYADSNRNAHRFRLVSSAKEFQSATIDGNARDTTRLEFTIGEDGVTFHRLSCELMCVAMDHLVDYLFMVAKS